MLDNPVAARPKSAEAVAAQRRKCLRERPASARTLRALGLAKLPEAERRQAHSRLYVLPCFGDVLPTALKVVQGIGMFSHMPPPCTLEQATAIAGLSPTTV